MGKTSEHAGAIPRRFCVVTPSGRCPLPTGRLVFDPALPTAAQLVRAARWVRRPTSRLRRPEACSEDVRLWQRGTLEGDGERSRSS